MPADMVSKILDETIGPSEDTMILWPGIRMLRGTSTGRALLFAHGLGGEETTPDFLRADCRELVRAGFVILSGDFGGQATWGNQAATDAVSDTLAYARAEGVVSNDPVISIGFSMGNLVCLNWAKQNLSDIAGHVGVVGAFDLGGLHAGDTSANLTTSINNAYGGSYSNAAHGADHNPAIYADDISSLPVVTWYSNGDTVTPPHHEAAFATAHGNTTRNAIPDAPPHGSAPFIMPVGYLLDAVEQLNL